MDSIKQMFYRDVLVRMLADFVLINCCFILASIGRFLWFAATTDVTGLPGFIFPKYFLAEYGIVIPLFSLGTCLMLHFFGVYTKNRSYPRRYKAMKLFQAVGVAFLVLFLTNYVLHLEKVFSLSLILTAWILSLGAIMATRFWSSIWRKMTITEIATSKRPLCNDEKHILVIGGAGYIGSALLPKLLKQGYRVRLLDLFVYGDGAIKDYIKHPHLEVIRADFRKVDEVVKAVKGVNTIIHLGAIVGDPACSLDENLTIEVNLVATRTIAEIAKGFGVRRFIFASTCSVYGAGDHILTEQSALNPVSLYAKTKIACEQVLLKAADSMFSPIILRFSTIFGFSGRTRFDLVVNLLTAKAKLENEITIYGGGFWRPLLHVDDAASSVMSALSAPLKLVDKQVYNVGNNQLNYTIKQIGEKINEFVPEAKLLEFGSDGDNRSYRVRFDKIQKELNFQTKWTLEQGIEQVLAAINTGDVVDYKLAVFSNAKYLQERGFAEKVTVRYFYDMHDLVADA